MLVEALNIIVGILVAIFCVGAVPFAITVISRLSRIEAGFESMRWQDEAINDLREKVHALELSQVRISQSNPSV